MNDGFNNFVKDLGEVLQMSPAQRARLAEILDDRMKAIVEYVIDERKRNYSGW